MENLTFVPLESDPECAADMIPNVYLDDMYTRGKMELESALNVNVLGLASAASDPAPNKWFGSEMYLATLLSKIMGRTSGCEILDTKYQEALEKVKKSVKPPSWVRNHESRQNQMYALLMYDAHKRMIKRFMSLPSSGQTVRCIINDCQLRRGYLAAPGVESRTEATLICWAKIENNHTVNNAFWSETAFRRMHRMLYRQGLRTFFRRGPLSEVYRHFCVKDTMSLRYTYPQVVRETKWNENLTNRLIRLGVTAPRETRIVSGWREATTWREWTEAVNNEERASNSVTDVTYTMDYSDAETRQSESRIPRANVTREDMMSAIQEPGEPTMLEHAAELARAATPALDEFTEACRNFTRQVGRSGSMSEEPMQNVERLRAAYEEEHRREMRTGAPEGEDVAVTPSRAYGRYIDAIQSSHFNMGGTVVDAGDESSNMDEVDLDAVDDVCRRVQEAQQEQRTRLTERNRQLREEWLGPDNLNNRGEPLDW